MIGKIFIALGILTVTVVVIGYLLPVGAELKHGVRINAPSGKVWKILANLESVQHYNPGVAKAEYITTIKSGIGAARKCDLKDGAMVKETVTGWEYDRAITMELTESPWPVRNMRWKTEVHNEGQFTRLSQVLTYEVKLGPIGRILNSLVMRNKMDKNLGQIFESLKQYAESRK